MAKRNSDEKERKETVAALSVAHLKVLRALDVEPVSADPEGDAERAVERAMRVVHLDFKLTKKVDPLPG